MASFFKRIKNLFGGNNTQEETQKAKENLDSGMEKTSKGIWQKISKAIAGRSTIDDDVLDNLEEAFISSDVGVDTTLKIIERIRNRVAKDKYTTTAELDNFLCEEISTMLAENSANMLPEDIESEERKEPYVMLVVGVNGVGKTTTIGKLAYQFKKMGNKVVLGAADTFRAAAIDQLQIWGDRVGVPVVKKNMGSDPAAVAMETLKYAKENDADVVIIDTAGRLHNKKSLMEELGKIKRVMQRVVPSAPDEVLLILDGSTGQNAFEQARQFIAATDVTGLVITKLDGTAKGGVVIAISDQFRIPVRFIGIGEGLEDLQIFNAQEFVRSLFGTTARSQQSDN